MKFIVATELGIIHQLKNAYPDREFLPATDRAVCPNMKSNTLEKVLWALEEMKHEVTVPADIREKAKLAVDRMLAVGRQE
jgi:quinolinate synthase